MDETETPKNRNGWGGARPGAGAPKGNLNALKHGRTSKRQAQLLESLLEVPEAREAFIALAKRARRRRKGAEEGAGVLMTDLLEKVAAIMLRSSSPLPQGEGPGVSEDNHDQNNQEFLDFLNLAAAQIRTLLEKQPRTRRTSIKRPKDDPA